jgi:hypothetical protein
VGTVVTGALVGADPVDQATVFIPNIALGAKLPPVALGPVCGQCRPGMPEDALAGSVTGADGVFTLRGVPAGTGIPLVVAIGKWRYETTIDVQPCVENRLPPGTARLPRKQSEGNIPMTAISTGNVDALECVLRKMGVDDSEFTNPFGSGRINLYHGNGAVIDATTPEQVELTGGNSNGRLNAYDQILFPCQGIQTERTLNELSSFVYYANHGGRVLATHFSYTWLYHNAGFGAAGQWNVGQPIPPSPLIANIDIGSQRRVEFAQWLEVVGALSQVTPPQVSINEPRRNLDGVPPAGGGERWIYAAAPENVQVLGMFTPVGEPADICGRVFYTDFHVADAMNSGLQFPAECSSAPLTAQEKVLEFMILELANCMGWVGPTKGRPPPITIPPPPLPPVR